MAPALRTRTAASQSSVEPSQKRQKRQNTIPSSQPNTQATLPFAPPLPASPTPPTLPTPPTAPTILLPVVLSEVQDDPEDREIRGDQRTQFEVDWELLKPWGKYSLKPRNLRNIGQNRISWIHQYGIELQRWDGKAFTGKYWLCQLCNTTKKSHRPQASFSTTSCGVHLRSHGIYPPGKEPPSSIASSSLITNHFEDVRLHEQPLYAERFRTAYINWVVRDDITFEQAASDRLREVILSGGPIVAPLLPSSRTVSRWIIKTFEARKVDLKASLTTALSKINLSFDLWSAPNKRSLLGVVAHWIDYTKTLKTALIALPEVNGHYGATHLAPPLQKLIEEYDIGNNLGAFQMDNADNNDTCLRQLATKFDINPAQQRMRCFGHVINLVVKALLMGTGLSKFQKELTDANDSDTFRIWRNQGAIGKLHNIIRYIMRSTQRIYAFNEAQQAAVAELLTFFYMLKVDTGIRWNSTYTMIERALKLEAAIRIYCDRWVKPKERDAYDLKKDFLDNQEWEELRHFQELLFPFYRATKHLEGHAINGSHGAIWEVLPAFEHLFRGLQKRSNEVHAIGGAELFTDHYMACLDAGFIKMKQYYTDTDKSTLYRAAIALHPCLRLTWFETHWKNLPDNKGLAEIALAKAAVYSLWSEYLAKVPFTIDAPTCTTQYIDIDNKWEAIFGIGHVTPTVSRRQIAEQELERFLSDAIDITFIEQVKEHGAIVTKARTYATQPLRWWRERGSALYPTLSTMAFDLFSIPAMSSECERAFSHAKKLITDNRHSLNVDTIEADQCLKSWLRSGIVDGEEAWQILEQVEQEMDEQQLEKGYE
jgi:hypothetical protein